MALSSELNKRSGRAVAWSSVTEILAKIVTPIVNLVLARVLTPSAFGAVATITMVITFAEIFTDAGFQKYVIQHEFSSDEELDRNTNVAFWTNFSVSTLIVVAIVIFRHQIAALVGSPELGNAIAIASLAIIMVSFSSIQSARFKRALDFKSLFFVRIGGALIPLVVTIPLAFALRSFWALVIGSLAVRVFNAIVLTLKSKWKPAFFYDFGLFKKMFSFSAWTLLESVSIWLSINADIFIVGNILNEHYLGIYKTSMTTVNSYIAIVASSILPVLFSTLSKCQHNEKEFQGVFFRFQKYVSLFVIPMSVGMFLYSDLVTDILLGDQWGEASGFVGLWGLISGFTVVFSNFASEVYRSRGNPRLSMLAQTLLIMALVPSVYFMAQKDFKLLYISRCLVSVFFLLVNIIFMRLVYKLSLRKMFANLFPAIVSTAIMVAAAIGLGFIMDAFWWDIVSVFICIIVYFVSLLLLFPKLRRELLSTPPVRKILSKFKRKKENSNEE